jgi:hypothetical protein
VGSIAPHKPVWINEVGKFLTTTSVRGLVSTPQTTAAAKALLAGW